MTAARSPDSMRQFMQRLDYESGIRLTPRSSLLHALSPTLTGQVIHLVPGTYIVPTGLSLTANDTVLIGYGAIFRRGNRGAGTILRITADRAKVFGITFDDDLGSGDAVRLINSRYVELHDIYVPAGPGGGVTVGNGVYLEASDNCLLHNVVVGADATRPDPPLGGEIWLDDNSDDCRIHGCDADGGVISYLGLSGTVDGVNIPVATAR